MQQAAPNGTESPTGAFIRNRSEEIQMLRADHRANGVGKTPQGTPFLCLPGKKGTVYHMVIVL